MKPRIVITGFGVVSPFGVGKQVFWSKVKAGASGLKPISTFDASGCGSPLAGEVEDFRPEQVIKYKGLSFLDRTSKLVCTAAQLAVDDAGLELTREAKTRTGVVLGTTHGSLHSFSTFDRGLMTKGFASISPLLFPNTVPNVPAGHVTLMLGLEGFSSTVSSGLSNGLAAVKLAAQMIVNGRARAVLAGGVDSLTLETLVQFYAAGLLAKPATDGAAACSPFDKDRSGISLAEGASFAVLETYEQAAARGATIHGEILGCGSAFDPKAVYRLNPEANGGAMSAALENSGLSPGSIDFVSAGANGGVSGDKMEALGIKAVFKGVLPRLKVGAMKSMTGECQGASGALQICAACLGMQEGVIPPTINLREKDADCDFEIATELQKANINTVMVCGSDNSGLGTSLIIGKQ